MTDPTTKDDKPKAPQGEVQSALPAERQEKADVSVHDEGKTDPPNKDSKAPVKPWRIVKVTTKCWEFAKWPESTNVAMAIATIVIAFATWETWREVQQSSTQTDKIVTSASKIQDALEDGNRQNRRTLRRTLEQGRAAMNASNEQSKASLDASIAASRIEQRAWIIIDDVHPSLEDRSPIRNPWVLTTKIKNNGRTPAFNVNIFAEVLPEQCCNLEITLASGTKGEHISHFGTVLPRGEEPIHESLRETEVPRRRSLSAEHDYERIRVVRGRIEYWDAFRRKHVNHICLYRMGGMDENLRFCPQGNDTDDSPEKYPMSFPVLPSGALR